MKLKKLICCLPLLWAPHLLALDIIDHAELVTALTYGYATYEESSLTRELELRPAIELSAGDNVSGRLSMRIRGDDEDRWLPGEPEFDNYENRSKPHNVDRAWVAELRDAYVDFTLPKGQLRLGKQQVVWGALDGIKVLDALNPQSFERFILEDFDESRIGLWSAYLDLTLGQWRTELIVSADDTTHYLPEPGAWMAFTAPRYRFGLPDTGNTIPVQRRDIDNDYPNGGLRISRYIVGIDVQLVAISGLDFEPLGELSLSSGDPILETFHERREIYGVSMETSFSAFALRTEIAFTPNRAFNTMTATGLATTELDNWRAAAGVDINAPWDLFINLQFLHDEVASTPANLVREEKEQVFTAFIKRRFAYDALDLELRLYQSLEYNDRLLRGSLRYAINDSTSLKFAVEDFKGDKRGPFGQFDQRDQVSLTLEFTL